MRGGGHSNSMNRNLLQSNSTPQLNTQSNMAQSNSTGMMNPPSIVPNTNNTNLNTNTSNTNVIRHDPFRTRPPNTSRPPSVHVDDFYRMESANAQAQKQHQQQQLQQTQAASAIQQSPQQQVNAASNINSSSPSLIQNEIHKTNASESNQQQVNELNSNKNFSNQLSGPTIPASSISTPATSNLNSNANFQRQIPTINGQVQQHHHHHQTHNQQMQQQQQQQQHSPFKMQHANIENNNMNTNFQHAIEGNKINNIELANSSNTLNNSNGIILNENLSTNHIVNHSSNNLKDFSKHLK